MIEYTPTKSLKDDFEVPNPGSAEAIALQCKCPRMDNGYGRGGYKGSVVALDCPLHNPPTDLNSDKK